MLMSTDGEVKQSKTLIYCSHAGHPAMHLGSEYFIVYFWLNGNHVTAVTQR